MRRLALTALAIAVLGCDGSSNPNPGVDCSVPDEGCVCDPVTDGDVSCYDGPGAEVGVGQCVKGRRVCDPDTLEWGGCSGQVLPDASESCDSVDNDCDGSIDEQLADCDQLITYPGPCTETQDVGPTGTIDKKWVFLYDGRDLLAEQQEDLGADGTVELRFVFVRDSQGRISLRETHDVNDAVVARTLFTYDGQDRIATLQHDFNVDTVIDQVDTYRYSAGKLLFISQDVGNNGSIEFRTIHLYDDAGLLVRTERETNGAVNLISEFIYDGAGNVTVRNDDNNVDLVVDDVHEFDYACW